MFTAATTKCRSAIQQLAKLDFFYPLIGAPPSQQQPATNLPAFIVTPEIEFFCTTPDDKCCNIAANTTYRKTFLLTAYCEIFNLSDAFSSDKFRALIRKGCSFPVC